MGEQGKRSRCGKWLRRNHRRKLLSVRDLCASKWVWSECHSCSRRAPTHCTPPVVYCVRGKLCREKYEIRKQQRLFMKQFCWAPGIVQHGICFFFSYYYYYYYSISIRMCAQCHSTYSVVRGCVWNSYVGIMERRPMWTWQFYFNSNSDSFGFVMCVRRTHSIIYSIYCGWVQGIRHGWEYASVYVLIKWYGLSSSASSNPITKNK